MLYKNIFYKTPLFGVLLFLLFSCSGGGSDSPIEPVDPEVIVPSDLIFTVELVGEDSNHPNGDGSGVINVSASAKDATSYGFRAGTGSEINNTTGNFEYTYSENGINNYTVDVLAYSKTGNSIKNSQDITVAVSPNNNLVWSDEFDVNGSPDTTKWVYDIGDGCPNLCGWGNNESQYYTNRTDNVIIENGVLKIIAKKEDYQGSEYTSARIKTQGKFDFKYGKVEIRAKLPEGGGTWPAFWMLGSNIDSVGWPACGEIDIMEHKGNVPGNVSSAIHTPSSYGGTINKGNKFVSDVSTEFHIYTVNWTVDKIEFAIDDTIFYTYNPSNKDSNTWPFDANQFIIFNVAMGGTFGGAIDSDFTEGTMVVDYIRAYQ